MLTQQLQFGEPRINQEGSKVDVALELGMCNQSKPERTVLLACRSPAQREKGWAEITKQVSIRGGQELACLLGYHLYPVSHLLREHQGARKYQKFSSRSSKSSSHLFPIVLE